MVENGEYNGGQRGDFHGDQPGDKREIRWESNVAGKSPIKIIHQQWTFQPSTFEEKTQKIGRVTHPLTLCLFGGTTIS